MAEVANELRLSIASPAAMEALGEQLARAAPEGCCIYLIGPLAAGKTTLARGFVHECGHVGAVKSPTYTLVESYEPGRRRVHHFDLYRLNSAEELEFIGIEEYFDTRALALIEWPERGMGVIPDADVCCTIGVAGDGRNVTIEARTGLGVDAVSSLSNSYKTTGYSIHINIT